MRLLGPDPTRRSIHNGQVAKLITSWTCKLIHCYVYIYCQEFQLMSNHRCPRVASRILAISFSIRPTFQIIGVARGCTCTPPQGGIFFRRNLQRKCVNASFRTRSAPPARARVNFLGHFFAGRVRFGGIFTVFWGRRLRKVVNFFDEKSAPRKIPAMHMFQIHFILTRLHRFSVAIGFIRH